MPEHCSSKNVPIQVRGSCAASAGIPRGEKEVKGQNSIKLLQGDLEAVHRRTREIVEYHFHRNFFIPTPARTTV